METKDESDGSITNTWDKTDFTEYAELMSGKSDEVFESQRRNALATWPQYVASETYIFRIRYRTDIDALKHRVLFDGKLFMVFPPVADNLRRDMLIQLMFLHTDNQK